MKLSGSPRRILRIVYVLLLVICGTLYIKNRTGSKRRPSPPGMAMEKIVAPVSNAQMMQQLQCQSWHDSGYDKELIHDKDELFDMTTGEALRTIAKRAGWKIKFGQKVDTGRMLGDYPELYDALLNVWIQKYNQKELFFSVHDRTIWVDTKKNKYNILLK